jgi:hypothetical protein
LEDEEAYICCAGVELRWRCNDCHKVSEGFAFPYGMCPHCKGKLAMLDRGAIEGDRALEAVRKAFEIELGGFAFYERASREADDPALGELFGRFAGMEKEHMDTLSKRYHAARPSSPMSSASPRIRPTCSGSPSPSSNGRRISSPGKVTTRRPARSSASCTGNWPPRSASTSRC